MTETSIGTDAAASVSASLARDFRVAGRAALVAAIVWLGEPIVFALTLLNPANMDPDQTLAEWRDAAGPVVPIAIGLVAIVFGVALAVLVTAVGRIRAARGHAGGYTVAIAHGLGILAAAAMFVAGAIDLTEGGLAGANLLIIPDASEGARWLASQSIAVVHESFRLTACLGFAAWLVVLAFTGRRAGLVGRAVAITIAVAAFLVAVPGAVTGLLTGMNLVLLALIPLAVAFLRRARRTDG